MFKNKVFVIFIISFLFIACSNSPDSKLVLIEDDTLKSILTNKELNVTWTNELEGNVLSQNITDFDFLVPGIRPTLNLQRAKGELKEPVYPEIQNFASLDFRNVPLSLRQFLNDFGSGLCSEESYACEKYFDSSYVFSYVFFCKDVENRSIKKFDSYIVGRPFFLEETIRVPFRLYHGKTYSDIFVCLKNNPSEYKVYNIYFIKAEE